MLSVFVVDIFHYLSIMCWRMKLNFIEERQLFNLFMQPRPQGYLSSSRQERERGDEAAFQGGKLTLSTQLIRPIFFVWTYKETESLGCIFRLADIFRPWVLLHPKNKYGSEIASSSTT